MHFYSREPPSLQAPQAVGHSRSCSPPADILGPFIDGNPVRQNMHGREQDHGRNGTRERGSSGILAKVPKGIRLLGADII
jgi:hypothetical protein